MSACKTDETQMRSVDSIKVSFLALILDKSYARSYHWGNWVKGTWDSWYTFFFFL